MRTAIVLLFAAAAVSGAQAGTDQPATRQQAPSAEKPLQTTVAARAIQPGELIVLTVDAAHPVDDVRVQAFGRDVPAVSIGARRWQALIGVDVDTQPGRHTVAVEAHAKSGKLSDTIALSVRARAYPTRTLKVDPAFVNPPPEAQARIQEEARLLNALWASASPSRLWSGEFIRPVPGRSSSRFGVRSIYNGEPRGRHSGEDFSGAEGTPVAAPNAGRVALAHDLYFSGNTVVIDHGVGLFSLLAHLSAIEVKEGEQVAGGQPIGRLGATGRVTGPHLHWAVRLNGARIDPSSLLATLGARK